ncbi:hypothetical protein SVIOM342S_01436 [Streptomyces violaceorubidus]
MRRKLLQALTAGLVLATATGCTYEDFPRLGMPTPTTEEAPRILSLWQGSWAAALATGVLVWGLILWSVFFHRRSRTKVEVPPQTRYNLPIEALYTMVPLVIVSVLFYFTARDESDLMSLKKKPDVTVNVVGFQWSWCFNHIEDVPGSTGDAKTSKELAGIPDRFIEDFPANAGGVYDCGTPGTRNPQTNNPGPTLWLPKGKTVRFVLQIGAPDVAFPRLNMFAYWLYLFGSTIAVGGFLTPQGAADFGWFACTRRCPTRSHRPAIGGDLWIMGLAFSGFGTILGSVNFITTIICMRALPA